jgi:hypothetical protein
MKGNPTMTGMKIVQNLEMKAGMMPLVNKRNSGSARSLQQPALWSEVWILYCPCSPNSLPYCINLSTFVPFPVPCL